MDDLQHSLLEFLGEMQQQDSHNLLEVMNQLAGLGAPAKRVAIPGAPGRCERVKRACVGLRIDIQSCLP